MKTINEIELKLKAKFVKDAIQAMKYINIADMVSNICASNNEIATRLSSKKTSTKEYCRLNEQLLRNSKFLFSVCGINLDRLSAISQQEKEKEPFAEMFPQRLLIK